MYIIDPWISILGRHNERRDDDDDDRYATPNIRGSRGN